MILISFWNVLQQTPTYIPNCIAGMFFLLSSTEIWPSSGGLYKLILPQNNCINMKVAVD